VQQNNDSHWNHKWSALALALLLTLFLAYGQYRGGWGPMTAAPVLATAVPAAEIIVVKKKPRRKPPASLKAAAINDPAARGARLREKGEAFGGGKEQQEETSAENSGK
jgi:hypothetical protein